jgi:transcriptional regulator with GAF, ATPase, and Fis domain
MGAHEDVGEPSKFDTRKKATMAITNLIGSSAKFRAVLKNIDLLASVDSTVMIQGETGTGKELVARAIHEASPRRGCRFVSLNCAAIPAALLESELFGHERGAFTGAVAQNRGRFEAADRGTLFLDEIGDLPIELQPKLLRVLQEKQFERLGSSRTIQVNVRVIAATNQNLWQMVQDRKFRADLYYRLNVFPVTLPALRERKQDIPLLAQYFVEKFAKQQGKLIETIPDEVMNGLKHHDWPGNIRELQNVIERAVIMTVGGPLLSPQTTEDLVRAEAVPAGVLEAAEPVGIKMRLADAERAHIAATLRETKWVVSGPRGAAVQLGIPRTTLVSKMQRLGIPRKASDGRSAQSTGRFEIIVGGRCSNVRNESPDFQVMGPAAS